MKRKSKDVTSSENVSPVSEVKKTADSLPKILRLASGKGSLQLQRVRCGKANCKCSRGELHQGHYFFLSSAGRLRKFYVRQQYVPIVREVIAQRKIRNAAFRAELREAKAFLQRMMSSVWIKI